MKSAATKPLVILFLILAIAAGIVGMMLLRQSAPQFQATATVHVVRDETDLEQLGKLAPQGTDTAIFLQNEIELIGSDKILQKVIERLDLNREWGNRFRDGQVLRAGETSEMLRANLQVLPDPASTQLHIRVASEQDAEAIKLANAIAAAYCEYRVERRQRIAQDKIKALTVPYQENEAKVRHAVELVEQARLTLDPPIRDQNPPPLPQVEEETVRSLQRELTRATMVYMAQSNKLSLSRGLPPNELQKLETQVGQTWVVFTNAEAALQTAARKQEALRAYWTARQALDKAETLFAPYRETVEANRRSLGPLDVAPAVLSEPATVASPLASNKVAAGKVCLLVAGILLVAAVMVFMQPHKPVAGQG